MERYASLQLLLGALVVGCAYGGAADPEGTQPTVGANIVECSWSATTTEVASDTVPGLDELVVYLADLHPTPARWWDGSETELFLEIDTSEIPALVTRTTYSYDAATAGEYASEEACAPFHYWMISFPVVAAGTSDGLLAAAASEVEIVCADNPHNRKPPEEGLPEGLCQIRVEFDLPVEVDPSRVAPGTSAPYTAEVVADAPHDGAIIAHVYAAGAGAADEGDTTATSDAVLRTLTN